MSSSPVEPADLLDLKLLPSWLKESDQPANYEHYEGEDSRGARDVFPERRGPRGRDDRREQNRGPRRPKGPGRGAPGAKPNAFGQGKHPRPQGRDRRPPPQHRPAGDRDMRPPEDLSARVTVRFLPHPPAFESVVAQIKANPISYSVFALARLFLEKPERYDVALTGKPDAPLYQLGEDGVISLDREQLETSAFRLAQKDFYRVDVVQGDPIKGNFPSVARVRLTGTVLGPTSHHSYQPKLRSLYEQRFSRRMSFPEFQRQIEIVTDPAVVEQWKEEARNITTFTALKEEPPKVFQTPAEAERDFRTAHLPGLVRPVTETTIGGVSSRQLRDRLGRYVETRWAQEVRSPSQMMPELTNRLREASVAVYRHRKGMLFVTSVRPRPFARGTEQMASDQVRAILSALEAQRGIQRKELADKLFAGIAPEEVEARKLALASDLRWLISEGHVIEFNDGTLDLPRVKPPAEPAEKSSEPTESVATPAPKPEKEVEADLGAADETSSSLPT